MLVFLLAQHRTRSSQTTMTKRMLAFLLAQHRTRRS